jgi:3-deoxy-D-manno-octulosonic acid kinase
VTVPAGYVRIGDGSVRAVVRADLAPTLGAWLLAPRLVLPDDARPLGAGRGAAWATTVAGTPAVVRMGRRGGVVARLLRETYLGVRPRTLRELAVTVEARRRGVAAPEVIAARVEGWLAYRGALVTVAVPDAATLIDAFAAAPDAAARRELARRAGRAVAVLHDAGLRHADLNLTNILVHPGGDGPAIVLVDFDRARLAAGPLGARARRGNLARLARSARKLDPAGALAGVEERRAFLRGYAPGRPEAACAC